MDKYYTMDIIDNVKNIKKIYMSDSSLNMLLDFERVLDNMDLYAFPNWLYGELVEGPTISKYWVKCKFMWPENLMPDPNGGKRLLPYGAKITYEKTSVRVPVKINNPDDYRDGSKKGKLVEAKVWYVDIMLPKVLMSEIKQGSVEIAGEDVDLSDLQSAYEKDLTQNSMTAGNTAAPMEINPNQMAMPPQMQAQGVPSVPPT
jgi:hypothetical protein